MTRDGVAAPAVATRVRRWALVTAVTLGVLLLVLLSGNDPEAQQRERIRAIQALDGLSESFAGWRHPQDLGIDEMFYAEGPLPPVFEDALDATEQAFAEFQSRARAGGFQLVALSAFGMLGAQPAQSFGRRFDPHGAERRLERMLDGLGIPLVNQLDYIERRGGSPAEARFSRDGHWNAQGHRWAAEALGELLRARPELCARRRAPE